MLGSQSKLERKDNFNTLKVDFPLTLSGLKPLSYTNQSINLQSISMDWFLHDNDLRHEWVKNKPIYIYKLTSGSFH